MAVANRALDLEGLKLAAKTTPALEPYVQRFEMIRSGIEKHCAGAVAWAVAYGSFIDLIGSGQTKRSRRRDKLLVVTTLPSLFDAVEILADKVFVDVFLVMGHLTDYRVWLMQEYQSALAQNTDFLRDVLSHGVTLYGNPPDDIGHADRGI